MKSQQRKKELAEMKYNLGILGRIDCTPEENVEYIKLYKSGAPLPEGIYKYPDQEAFYLAKELLSESERQEYLALRQYNAIKTIRNCIILFAILVVSSIVLTFLFQL